MNVFELIKRHEGLSLLPYECSAGKLTIGYGHNLDDLGITKEQAEALLSHDVFDCVTDLNNSFDWFPNLSPQRQAAMLDMRFNLGKMGFRKFRKMIEALEKKDYDKAADEMLDSKWATQVSVRAVRLADIMRNDISVEEALKKTY